MRQRWLLSLSKLAPAIDFSDLENVSFDEEELKINEVLAPGSLKSKNDQFASEYSQKSYESMLDKEFAFGDYIAMARENANSTGQKLMFKMTH